MRSTDLGVSSNYSAITAESSAVFADRLRAQFAGALAGSTLNGATLADVGANSIASNKVASVNESVAGVDAFMYGNSLVSTVATADAAGVLAAGDGVVNGVDIAGSDGTVADLVAKINAKTGEHGITADAAAAETLVLSNTNGDAITMKVNSANAATATGYVNGSTNTSAAGSNGAIVLNYDVGTTALAVNAAATAGALEGSTADAVVGLTSANLAAIDVNSGGAANIAMLALDNSLDTVAESRARLGAVQNRLESTVANISTTVENLSAARSRIRDADFASETAELTRSQILQQAGTAMLSQANSLPSNVLALLQ